MPDGFAPTFDGPVDGLGATMYAAIMRHASALSSKISLTVEMFHASNCFIKKKPMNKLARVLPKLILFIDTFRSDILKDEDTASQNCCSMIPIATSDQT